MAAQTPIAISLARSFELEHGFLDLDSLTFSI